MQTLLRLNPSLESFGISPFNVHAVAKHSRAAKVIVKLRKLLDVYKDSIGTAYNVQDLYLEESQNTKNVLIESKRNN